jgi:hypothetical protein
MSKLVLTAIGLVIAGIISGAIEQIFYGGRLDENNVVQDSFFLPLSFMLIFVGVAMLVASVILNLLRRAKTS